MDHLMHRRHPNLGAVLAVDLDQLVSLVTFIKPWGIL